MRKIFGLNGITLGKTHPRHSVGEGGEGGFHLQFSSCMHTYTLKLLVHMHRSACTPACTHRVTHPLFPAHSMIRTYTQTHVSSDSSSKPAVATTVAGTTGMYRHTCLSQPHCGYFLRIETYRVHVGLWGLAPCHQGM
jgi:hypothetical protein